MPEFTKELAIPFTPNTGRRCVPACADMIAKHLLPDRSFTFTEIEAMSGFREGYSTWAAQHLLSLNDLGVDVGWIQDEDLPKFAKQPEQYIRHQLNDQASYEAFAATNDLTREAARISEYLNRGLLFEQRPATQEDITTRMLGGWVVRLEVNGKALADQPGDAAHAVVVSGFNDEVIRLENPDGVYGSKPKQIVTWEKLHEAWADPIMQYYRVVEPTN